MSASLFSNYTWAIPFKNQQTTISVVDKNPAEARRTIAAYIASCQKTHKRIEITGINNKHGRECVEDLETDLRNRLKNLSDLVSCDFFDETLSARIDALLVSTEPTSVEPANEPRFLWECEPKIRRV
jgi:hypothetical protein